MMEKKKKNQAYNGRCRTHEQRSGRALDDAGSGAAAGIKPVFISRADIRQFKKKTRRPAASICVNECDIKLEGTEAHFLPPPKCYYNLFICSADGSPESIPPRRPSASVQLAPPQLVSFVILSSIWPRSFGFLI